MKTKRFVSLPLLAAVLWGATAEAVDLPAPPVSAEATSSDASDGAPFNVVVIVLDCSISFRVPSKAPGMKGKVLALEALHTVQQLFHDGAKQKRRRTDGRDLYYLIVADAASQLIWSGTRDQLALLTPDALAQKLAVRDQFTTCTDLEAALNEAAAILRKHPEASESYVLTFSDLLHEPPVKGWQKCAPKSGDPPRGIDWHTLSRAHLGFYFVSKDFPYRPDAKWKAELERRGLQADFFDAVQALSAGIVLSPPQLAVYKPTKEQVLVAQGQAQGFTHSVVNAATWLGTVIILSVAALFGWVLLVRHRGGTARRKA